MYNRSSLRSQLSQFWRVQNITLVAVFCLIYLEVSSGVSCGKLMFAIIYKYVQLYNNNICDMSWPRRCQRPLFVWLGCCKVDCSKLVCGCLQFVSLIVACSSRGQPRRSREQRSWRHRERERERGESRRGRDLGSGGGQPGQGHLSSPPLLTVEVTSISPCSVLGIQIPLLLSMYIVQRLR